MVEQSVKQASVKAQGGTFKYIEEESIPVAGAGEVLIRVHYSTVNPYDRYIQRLNANNEGFVLGSDGSGIVQAVGEGVDSSWVGKKVAFAVGAWARYTVKKVDQLVQFKEDFDLKHGANTFVNPFTVIGLLELAQKRGSKAVIVLAAASALGKQFIRYAQQNGIITINVVRKDEHVQDLKENVGAEYVLNQNSPTFQADLDKLIKEKQAQVLYECIGGSLAAEIFSRMPSQSLMVIYGNLSSQQIALPFTMGWNQHEISSFYLTTWLQQRISAEERQKWFKVVAQDLEDGGKIFGTKIAKTVHLADWEKFVWEAANDATNGKYLVSID